jgi:hypothetical protein
MGHICKGKDDGRDNRNMEERISMAKSTIIFCCLLVFLLNVEEGSCCCVVGWGDDGQCNKKDACKPVPLLRPDPETHTKLVVMEEGLGVLRAINGAVAVVSVVGKARTGKSLAMDTVIGVQPTYGFLVNHTEHTETIGADIWPIPLRGGDGMTNVVVIVRGSRCWASVL